MKASALSIRARWASLDRSRIQRLAKESSWVVAGQIASVLGMLVLVRVLTEYLNPAQYGELALGLTVAGLVNQVVMGGLNAGIGRFYSIAAEKNDLNGYLHASRRLMGYATVVVVAIAAVLMVGLVWLGYSQWMGLAATALIFSVLSGYNASLNGIQNAARQRAIVAFHGGLDAWLKILLAVGVMHWLGSTSMVVVLGYALSLIMVTGSQFFLLRRDIPHLTRTSPEAQGWTWKILAYSLPFSTWGLFSWAQQTSDRWALQSFATIEEVGQYTVVFQLGYMPIGLATGMVISFVGPVLFQRSGNATDPVRNSAMHYIAWRITWACFGVTAIACAVSWLLHEWIFKLLVAAEYRTVSYLLPWAVLAGGVFAAGQLLALKLMADMKTRIMTTAKIVTAVLGVLLNIIGALFFGAVGVVLALVAFSAIYFLWMMWLARHNQQHTTTI